MRTALLIAVLAAAVGCGSSEGASGSSAATELSISVWGQGRGTGTPTKWTLRCGPAGGTLPRPAAACRQLLAMTRPFAPIPKDVMCTEQYGGPQQAVISGTFRGQRIWTVLTLRNGCEIARAKRLGFLVPGFSSAGSS